MCVNANFTLAWILLAKTKFVETPSSSSSSSSPFVESRRPLFFCGGQGLFDPRC
jgi:hypothetical protein